MRLDLLLRPLDRLAALNEQNNVMTFEIHQVVTVDLKKAANEGLREMKKHTSLLTDIKNLLKDQNKQLAAGGAGKGGAAKSAGFKPMSAKDTGLTALMIVGVAGALVAAAALFALIPAVSLAQLATGLAVAGIMLLIVPAFVKIADVLSKFKGTTSVNIEGIDMAKGDMSGVWHAMGATLVSLVGISAALVLSAAVLTLMPTISLQQFGTALAVGIIMIPAAYAFAKLIDALREAKIKPNAAGVKQIGMVALAGVAIALSLVGIAWTFKLLPDEYKAPPLMWSLQIGLALFMFSASFYLIMKGIKGASIKEIAFGAIAIPAIALGIVGLAYVFQYLPDAGAYKSPPYEWMLLSALSVLAFSVSFYLIMKAVKGASMKELIFGAFAIPILAVSIIGTAWIFSYLGDDFKAPPYDWTLKAGLAILVFGISFALITVVIAKAGIKLTDLLLGTVAVAAVGLAILGVAWIFTLLNGVEFIAPPIDWAIAAGIAITIFAIPVMLLSGFIVATGGTGALALLAGVIGIVLIAGAMWAVAWIFSKMPDLSAIAKNITDALMTPVNAMVDVLKRFKDEIGIENLLPLAGGLVAVAGGWLALVGALAGQAVGGLASSIANVGTAIFDGISKLFGGEGTQSPMDLLDALISREPGISKLIKPMSQIGDTFQRVAMSTETVIRGVAAFGKFLVEDNAENFERSAKAATELANAYVKFSNASKTMNIQAIKASTEMFNALTKLAEANGEDAMTALTDKLLEAVKDLSEITLNLQKAVNEQGQNTSGIGNALSGAIGKVTEVVTGATDKAKKMVSDAKAEAGQIDLQPVIDALEEIKDRFDTPIYTKEVNTP